MQLALLGIDEQTLAVARALASGAAGAASQIVAFADIDDGDPRLAQLLRECWPPAKPLSGWEALLDRTDWQAVLVARGGNEDERSEQLRKLAQFAVPVLFSHPVVDSSLLLFELDMIRRDTRAVLVPYLPQRLHPAIAQLQAVLAAGEASPVGRTGLISFDRHLLKHDRANVEQHFARDVDLLRSLTGELTQLSALTAGAADSDLGYENLTVQLAGPSGVSARYNVCAATNETDERGVVTLLGSRGKIEFNLPAHDDSASNLVVPKESPQHFTDWNPALAAYQNLQQACAGEPISPDLLDAARASELAATIPRSLKRRRTIELHLEDHTEENTFKGMMAAGGCLLLMVAPLVLLVAALLDKAGVPFVGIWPWLLAALFGGFILLQLLLWVSKRKT
jgi:myo-inositol 2-dehydrogenase/D-chiro-inositol 1-dehydrogenase